MLLHRTMVWAVALVVLLTWQSAAHAQANSGVLDANGAFKPIAVPGASFTWASGINNVGQIVGSYNDRSGRRHGFLYADGTFTTIDGPGNNEFSPVQTTATGINDAGQVVGTYWPSDPEVGRHTPIQGFIYAGGTFTTFNGPDFNTYINGINNAGQIIGQSVGPSGFGGFHAFLYAGGTFTTIDMCGDFPGCSAETWPEGINDAGQIVGTDFGQGFLYSGGAFRPFQMDDGSPASPLDINNVGQIVGSTAGHGFRYAAGVFSTIDVPGSIVNYAAGINDLGQIVVGGVFAVPEPDSLVLFSVGLLGLGLAWRHSRAARIRLT